MCRLISTKSTTIECSYVRTHARLLHAPSDLTGACALPMFDMLRLAHARLPVFTHGTTSVMRMCRAGQQMCVFWTRFVVRVLLLFVSIVTRAEALHSMHLESACDRQPSLGLSNCRAHNLPAD